MKTIFTNKLLIIILASVVAVGAVIGVLFATGVIWHEGPPASDVTTDERTTGNPGTTGTPESSADPDVSTGEDVTPEGTTDAAEPTDTEEPPATTGEIVTREADTTDDGPQIIVTPDTTADPIDVTTPETTAAEPVDTTATPGPSDTTAPEDTTAQIEISDGETSQAEIIETAEPVCQHLRTQVRDAVNSTCLVPGYTGNTYCVDCGKLLSTGTATAVKAHTVVTVAGVAPTCTATGLTSGTKCSVCGTVLTQRTVIPATGHTVVNVAAVPSTCTTNGTSAGTKCSTCGVILSGCQQTALAVHTPVIDPGRAATCTQTALSEGSHCSVCGKVLAAQRVIAAADGSYYAHDFSVLVRTVAPRVGMPGYSIYKCSHCGQEDANVHDIVPMLEGDYALQHKGDRAPETGEFHIHNGEHQPYPIPAVEIQKMSYEFHPDNTRLADNPKIPVTKIQPAVLVARDGTEIYGKWKWLGTGIEEKDKALGLPNPGWTFAMDFTVYPVGEEVWGWCYNKVLNTIVRGGWYFDLYGTGTFTAIDTIKNFKHWSYPDKDVSGTVLNYTYRSDPYDDGVRNAYASYLSRKGLWDGHQLIGTPEWMGDQ